MKILFIKLSKMGSKIRKTIACQLHEVAKLIGEKETESVLLEILLKMLKDKSIYTFQ